MNRTEWSLLSPCHTVTNAALQRNNEICNILASLNNQRFADLCSLPSSPPLFLSVHVGENLIFIIIMVCCWSGAPRTRFCFDWNLWVIWGVGAELGMGLREALLLWLTYWDTVLGREPGSVPQVYDCLVTLTEDWGLALNNRVTDLASMCLRVCWLHGLWTCTQSLLTSALWKGKSLG